MRNDHTFGTTRLMRMTLHDIAWHCMTFGTVILADLDSSEFEDLSTEKSESTVCLNVSGKHFDFGALHAFSGTMLAPTKAGTLQQ